MKNKEIADIFDKIADILEFKGAVIFKINAYRKASRTIGEMSEDITELWESGKLSHIPGVGKGLQEKIDEYLSTGRINEWDELLKDTPSGIFDLLAIQNFGPKTAALVFKELHVRTLEDLQRVIDNNSLATLPGMGQKKIEKIKKSLQLRKLTDSRHSIGIALPIVEDIVDYMKTNAGDFIGRISSAGSVRRFRETVHDIDILAETTDGKKCIEIFTNMPGVTQVMSAGETKASIMLDDRFQVDLRAIAADSYGAAQQYFTGSKEHNVRIREIAKKQNYKVNEYGVFDNDKKIAGQDEKQMYQLLGMQWIPAELREDRGEVRAAQTHKLPKLVKLTDIKGDLHIHSNYSDGQKSVQVMAMLLRNMGYQYMAICDHSRSARYANGLGEDRLKKQIDEIKELNEQFNDFHILAGSEVDILPDGSLDYRDDILKKLDFVIASIHTAFNTDPTNRTIRAMYNQYVDVIGHPTGRLISRREAFEINLESIIKIAAETGTALEVNSFWDRLDLSDLHIKNAIENNVKICINTDSHHPNHLAMIELGVGTARRGWATRNDIINTLEFTQLLKWQKRFH